jgi:hypothetical protein
MTPNGPNHSATDHGTGEPQGPLVPPGNIQSTVGLPFVPLAEPIPGSIESPVELTPTPEGPADPGQPLPSPGFPGPLPWPPPFPWPPPRLCLINLRTGCYRITFRPNSGFNVYRGTMRVDAAGGTTTISGDLYRFLARPFPFPASAGVAAEAETISPTVFPLPHSIPIYARNRYHSYLKVTNVQRSPIFTSGPCQLTLTAEEYAYTQPPAGSFDGTFPTTPTRTVTIVLEPKPALAGFISSYFEGTLYEAGVARGTFTMGWVSSFFRRATLEIDTLTGAVAPQAVPASSGSGTEDFRTVLATAGWDLNVVIGQTNVPVPAGVNPNACWSSADLHALMSTVRDPATNLDAEWRLHLVVVPATMSCGRGVMYDVIQVPREGVASFSDDGYPSSQSATFGTAANQQQRNVLRAFLRSASHEVGHGFNQIHQEQEAGADNSIMTTTPSVADVLGGPTTGEPGVFPDNINLGFNEHVRHHLVHFPDIVVRPGGMTFGSGHSSVVPEADRQYVSEQELELRLEPVETQIELGEPLQLAWTLVNRSEAPIPVPSDVRIEAQHAFITVTDPSGTPKPMPSFVIETEPVKIEPLDPGQELRAETRVFWSSRGFAFETPGKHILEVRISWTYGGVPFGVRASTNIWVNYPQSTTDNDAAATLLDPEVGMYVALGGGASHLREAVSRLESVLSMGEADQPRPQALRGYEGLLPSEREETSGEETDSAD